VLVVVCGMVVLRCRYLMAGPSRGLVNCVSDFS